MVGLVAIVPIHSLSVEHQKLERIYGKETGIRVGRMGTFLVLNRNMGCAST